MANHMPTSARPEFLPGQADGSGISCLLIVVGEKPFATGREEHCARNRSGCPPKAGLALLSADAWGTIRRGKRIQVTAGLSAHAYLGRHFRLFLSRLDRRA